MSQSFSQRASQIIPCHGKSYSYRSLTSLSLKFFDAKVLFSSYISVKCNILFTALSSDYHFVLLFLRLDYSGIAIFIMGSFIPPLYYGFYCSRVLKIVYICMICSLGITCIVVSLWDKFNAPEYRLLRAGKVFIFY